ALPGPAAGQGLGPGLRRRAPGGGRARPQSPGRPGSGWQADQDRFQSRIPAGGDAMKRWKRNWSGALPLFLGFWALMLAVLGVVTIGSQKADMQNQAENARHAVAEDRKS